jgi:hypothetical protein
MWAHHLVDYFSGSGNAENHIQSQQLNMESSDNCAINNFWTWKW